MRGGRLSPLYTRWLLDPPHGTSGSDASWVPLLTPCNVPLPPQVNEMLPYLNAASIKKLASCFGIPVIPKAHSGFYEAWQSLRRDLLREVQKIALESPEKRIFCTGICGLPHISGPLWPTNGLPGCCDLPGLVRTTSATCPTH